MTIKSLINDWIAASNAFDTEKYLGFYFNDAVLDDPLSGENLSGMQESKIILKATSSVTTQTPK